MDILESKPLAGRRVGIVTPYDSNNYGAYLQAFSTMTVLKRAGADAAFLRFRGDAARKALFYRDKPGKRELLDMKGFKSRKAAGQRKYEVFSEAWKRFYTETLADFMTRDSFVLGSDEIWNVKHAVFRNNPVFFGRGLHNAVSYAPSVGKATAAEIEANTECAAGMRSLKTVLVRDEKSADAVEEVRGTRPKIVLDPTLLLEWDEVAEPCTLPERPFVLVYAYNSKNLPVSAIREFAHSRGLRTVSVGFDLGFCDEVIEPDPLAFYSLMRAADYVVTTTFHGSIFAMLSHSSFLSFPTSQKTNHLLSTFGLEGRSFPSAEVCSVDVFAEALCAPIDYEAFEALRRQRRDESIALLIDALKSAATKNPGGSLVGSVVDAGMCTGCQACRCACPKGAITMVPDAGRALVPHIDAEKCIGCGKCDRVCPSVNPIGRAEPLACYAAWAEEGALNPKSSSGGLGYLLARNVVAQGGVAFGAVDDAGTVRHAGADTVDACDAFCGSKYTQSDVGDAYRQVADALRAGRKTFFAGTPCQVAGLRSYLDREYEDLLTADLICHGVPPQELLAEHAARVLGKGADYDGVGFRTKKKFILSFSKGDQPLYSGDMFKDSYLYCFMKCLVYRESCYECPYARGERVGDVTIGDFWGLDRSSLQVPYEGRISAVMANTAKGRAAVEALEGLHLESRDYDEARAGNPQLRRPSIKRGSFRELRGLLSRMPFDDAFRASSEWKNFRRDALKESSAWLAARSLKKRLLGR